MRYNILCIDEFGITKVELANILKNLDINIINARDENDALDVLSGMITPVSAIVWSLNSTELKDFEAIKKVNGKDEYKNIPIVIISKFTGKKYVMKAVESGAVDYIAKPYDETAVLKKLCKVMGIPFEKAVERMNHEDFVTYNFYEMFNKEIKAAARGGYPMTLVLVSVVPNSSEVEHGGEVDELAVLIASVLKTKLRETDIVFNCGGNSLIVILPFTGKDNVDCIKKKIYDTYNDHTMIKPKKKGYDLVFSSVTYPDDGRVKEKLLEKLEQGLDVQLKGIHNKGIYNQG